MLLCFCLAGELGVYLTLRPPPPPAAAAVAAGLGVNKSRRLRTRAGGDGAHQERPPLPGQATPADRAPARPGEVRLASSGLRIAPCPVPASEDYPLPSAPAPIPAPQVSPGSQVRLRDAGKIP